MKKNSAIRLYNNSEKKHPYWYFTMRWLLTYFNKKRLILENLVGKKLNGNKVQTFNYLNLGIVTN